MTIAHHNQVNAYDADGHVAEIYDQYVTGLEDVSFIRKLIANDGPLKTLEPFCGTGRILLPLALDGHCVHGMDQSKGMLQRAKQKIQQQPLDVQRRVLLTQSDVLCNE